MGIKAYSDYIQVLWKEQGLSIPPDENDLRIKLTELLGGGKPENVHMAIELALGRHVHNSEEAVIAPIWQARMQELPIQLQLVILGRLRIEDSGLRPE
jgi:hypothetical protein